MHRTRYGAASKPDGAAHGHGHANADRITYTLTGTLTGTLTDSSSASVTDAAFRWQVIGDTTTGTNVLGLAPVPVFELPARKDTIRIGDEVLSPTIPTVFATATVPAPVPFGISGFSDVTTNHGLAWQSPALASYDGTSALSALPVTFDNAGSLPTTAGDLTITAASALQFSAVTC